MARDTAPMLTLLDQIAALSQPFLDPERPRRLADARKRVSSAIKASVQAGAAFLASGGTEDKARERDAAQAEERRARSEVAKIERQATADADAATQELSRIVDEIAKLTCALADGMRQVAERTHEVARAPQHHYAFGRWPEADAAARGLAALAAQLRRQQ